MFSRYFNIKRLRSKIEFKHVRFKSSVEFIKKEAKLSKETIKHRSEILCNLLNCNVHTAREIITKNKGLEVFSHHNFYQNAKFCKNHLKFSDIIEYPTLLTLQPSLLQHRYFSLKELGFSSVTPSYILRFSYILKKTPQELKKKGFPVACEYKSSILAEYLSASERTEINQKLQQMYEDGSDFQKIREVMNAEFLAAKLGCSIGTARMMLHKHAALRVQSIFNTDQLLNVLLYRLNFSNSKICKFFSLLSAHYENVEYFLSEIPVMLGVNTMFLVRRLPLLLKQESDYFHKIETVLKDFDINNEQLINCPKVLSLSPSTVHKRLTALCSTEDLAVLKSNKKFLWLVYNYNNLNSRLKRLKSENMPCSIGMFTTSKDTFEKYLLYNNSRRAITETYAYLAEIFKMDEKEIFTRLGYCSHIQGEDQNFSTLNCRRVIEFLLISGVSKTQIFNGLEIVYFEVDTVKFHFSSLKNHPQCQPYEEWVSHYNFIQLLIYIIEANKHHSYNIEINEHEGEEHLEVSSNYSS